MSKLAIIIGRGRSATRLFSNTLSSSGFYMGPTNATGDLVPPDEAYAVAREYVALRKEKGSFAAVPPPTDEQREKILKFLRLILCQQGDAGFKLPECNLFYPWLVKMFPDAYFIHVIRSPSVIKRHVSDGFLGESMKDNWLYHLKIVTETPRPRRLHRVIAESFILNQDHELRRLGIFLDRELAKLPVRTEFLTGFDVEPEDERLLDAYRKLGYPSLCAARVR